MNRIFFGLSCQIEQENLRSGHVQNYLRNSRYHPSEGVYTVYEAWRVGATPPCGVTTQIAISSLLHICFMVLTKQFCIHASQVCVYEHKLLSSKPKSPFSNGASLARNAASPRRASNPQEISTSAHHKKLVHFTCQASKMKHMSRAAL
jgi:hypothetical protein